MKEELKMKFDKATKNTYVFAATKDDAIVPTIYIKKSAFDKQPPEIKLTIESE
jgi:hypothetical protein